MNYYKTYTFVQFMYIKVREFDRQKPCRPEIHLITGIINFIAPFKFGNSLTLVVK